MAAQELELVVEDPDAGRFVHWTLLGIPPTIHYIAEGDPPAGTVQTENGFGKKAWGGPCPPEGKGPHRYVFALYATDAPLKLADSASADDVRSAIAKHAVATGRLTGRFAADAAGGQAASLRACGIRGPAGEQRVEQPGGVLLVELVEGEHPEHRRAGAGQRLLGLVALTGEQEALGGVAQILVSLLLERVCKPPLLELGHQGSVGGVALCVHGPALLVPLGPRVQAQRYGRPHGRTRQLRARHLLLDRPRHA